jgi:hypothetical protein
MMLFDVWQSVVAPSSPYGNIHAVLSIGSTVFQTAWNSSVNEQALNACIAHHSKTPIPETFTGNSGINTRELLPCMRMQVELGWKLGLSDELKIEDGRVSMIRKTYPGTIVIRINRKHVQDLAGAPMHCEKCEKPFDIVYFDSKCHTCFLKVKNGELR